jgi:cysteine-rich repeat protein
MLAAAAVWAQGVVSYGPSAQGVPMLTLGSVGLYLLVALLAVSVFVWGRRWHVAVRVAAFMGLALLLSQGVNLLGIDAARAVAVGLPFDRPTGGQINLSWGPESHENTSGVPIQISGVTYDAQNDHPTGECVAGLVLQPSQSCGTKASALCGNGHVENLEACDDGNSTNGDGCSATCTVETGFHCSGSPSVCASTCGDGIVSALEACDDGNSTNGDGCSATCTVEPGYTCTGAFNSVCVLN